MAFLAYGRCRCTHFKKLATKQKQLRQKQITTLLLKKKIKETKIKETKKVQNLESIQQTPPWANPVGVNITL